MNTFGRSRLEICDIMLCRMLGMESPYDSASGRPRPTWLGLRSGRSATIGAKLSPAQCLWSMTLHL
eukprot:5401578-Alexandrium_andersonii.AAC.1